MSRDDCRVPIFRDLSRDGHMISLCRDTHNNGCITSHYRDVSRHNSRWTVIGIHL